MTPPQLWKLLPESFWITMGEISLLKTGDAGILEPESKRLRPAGT